MGSQVGFWKGIPSRILGGIGRMPGGILLSTVSFESLRLGNLDNPCKIFVGIPPRIPGGIPGGILEREPMWDPRWDREDPRWDFNSPNIFYICLVHIGIPLGLESQLGSRVGSKKKTFARFSKVGSQVKSQVVYEKVNI